MSLSPQERFKNRVIQFCDFVKGILQQANNEGLETPVSPFILDLVKNFIKKEDSDKIITTFILRSHASWERAKNKEQDYFRTDGLKAFYGIPEKNLNDFNALFDCKKADGSLLFDETVQSIIWEIFESFIKDSICYVHLKRCPDPTTKKYTANFIPEISVKKQVEAWKLTSLD
jgi:hypothetical protein